MIYLSIYGTLAVFSCFDILKDGQKLKAMLFWFIIFILIFISAIRWNVGTDWESYLSFYQQSVSIVEDKLPFLMETGFTYLNYAANKLQLPYSGYLVAMAILTIGIKAHVFYHHKSILMMCLFLYFCYYLADIFAVRQYLAISITLYATKYILERRLLLFLIAVLIASSIHISSLFFIVAYWAGPMRYRPWMLYGLLMAALLLGLFDVGGMLAQAAISLAGIDSRVGEKLLFYDSEGLDTAAGNPYIAFSIGVAKRVIFLPIFIGMKRYISPENENRYCTYLNLLVLGNILYLIFMVSLPVMARLSTGFLIYEIFLLGYLVQSVADWRLKMCILCLLLLFGAFRLYNLMNVYWHLYVPFETIFAPIHIDRG